MNRRTDRYSKLHKVYRCPKCNGQLHYYKELNLKTYEDEKKMIPVGKTLTNVFWCNECKSVWDIKGVTK